MKLFQLVGYNKNLLFQYCSFTLSTCQTAIERNQNTDLFYRQNEHITDREIRSLFSQNE